MKKRFIGIMTAAMIMTAYAAPVYYSGNVNNYVVHAGYEWAGSECDPAHDTSRNVQKEGVGNPFNYGERNTPANASTSEIRQINHNMTVQEVKYALYKEIDEHWELISKRLGQTEREKVYALFLGLGTRESTLGGNGDGADIETAQQDGFGVNPAHAYGTMQTAVTAFADCNPTFDKEDNVPEMYQYTFNESNFYDAIVSNHMGIRKILHFAELCINKHGMHGYQVVRNCLKGFNTGWCDMAEDAGAYRTYADEICAMAQFYYNEGHLYDNVFTWTESPAAAAYRTDDRWSWWGDTEPSMDPVNEQPTEPDTEPDTQPDTEPDTSTAHDTYEFYAVYSYPDKKAYKTGEALDLTGLKFSGLSSKNGEVLCHYTEADLSRYSYILITDKSGKEFSKDEFTSLPEGEYTVSITGSAGWNDAYNLCTDVDISYKVTIGGDGMKGDANCDGSIDMSDAVMVMQASLNPQKYGENGTSEDCITPQGMINANVDGKDGIDLNDALLIQKYSLHIINKF